MLVAVPFGLGTAIYLSEYAPPTVRKVVKPIIEVLAGIPSVIVGFFVLNFVAPELVNQFFNQPAGAKTMLAAGLGIGILVIPIMASVSEDALSAVPSSLREASYGCGARKVNTVIRVVAPGGGLRHRRRLRSSPSRGRSARRWSPRWPPGTTAPGRTPASTRSTAACR